MAVPTAVLDAGTPEVVLRKGRTLQLDDRSPGRISWDSAGGGATYDLRVRKQFGGGGWSAWTGVVNGTSETHRDRTIYADTTYQYEVRARSGGNKGPWGKGDPFRIDVVGDDASAITYTGTWSVLARSSALGGHVHRTTDVGASATLSRKSASMALVTPTGPAYGTIKTCIDPGTPGQECRIIDLGALSTEARRLVTVFNGLDPDVSHKLRVRLVSGAAALDAMVVLR